MLNAARPPVALVQSLTEASATLQRSNLLAIVSVVLYRSNIIAGVGVMNYKVRTAAAAAAITVSSLVGSVEPAQG